MEDTLKIISDLGQVVQHSPAWLLIIVALNLVGYYLKWSSWCPNKVIPAVIGALGIVLNLFLGPLPASEQRSPYVFLAVMGVVMAAISIGLHMAIVDWFNKKFKIPDQDTIRGRTEILNKSDITKNP